MQLQQPWDERRCFTGREHALIQCLLSWSRITIRALSTSTVLRRRADLNVWVVRPDDSFDQQHATGDAGDQARCTTECKLGGQGAETEAEDQLHQRFIPSVEQGTQRRFSRPQAWMVSRPAIAARVRRGMSFMPLCCPKRPVSQEGRNEASEVAESWSQQVSETSASMEHR